MSHSAKNGVEKCMTCLNQTSLVQMGILNITPDSFSDGGRFQTAPDATRHALALVSAGAHIIDVGGISTRPGSHSLDSVQEWLRVRDILKSLRSHLPDHVLVSLDTSSPYVAFQAAKLGLVDLINDVFAARKQAADDEAHKDEQALKPDWTTAHVAAHFNLGLILMHMQGEPRTMQNQPTYHNCVEDVTEFLKERLHFAVSSGVRWCAVDPGIGFGKTLEHNLELLSANAMTLLQSLDAPILIGLSRKSFLKALAERQGVLPRFNDVSEEMDWRDSQSETWERDCAHWGARLIRTHKIKRLI